MKQQPEVLLEFSNVTIADNKIKRGRGRTDRAHAQAVRGVNLSLNYGDKVYVEPTLDQDRVITFFKLIFDTLKPTDGTVTIKGNAIGPSANFGIWPRANVDECLMLRALRAGKSIASAKTYIEKTLSEHDLKKFRHVPFHELPKDMKSLLMAESLVNLNSSIFVMNRWMTSNSEDCKKVLRSHLVKLIERSSIALVSINRPDIILSLCTHKLDFTDSGEAILSEL